MQRGLRYVRTILLACLVTTAWIASARAAVPNTISYQGLLTDGTGAPVADGTYDLTFKLYYFATGPGVQWSELQSAVSVTGGVFSVQLGSVNPLTLAFDRPLFLGISVGAEGELAPRTPLSSSPYALGVRLPLPASSVDATVLIDEPGIAQSLYPGSYNVIGNANISPVNLYPDVNVTINTPGPGYVMVTASAYVTFSNVTAYEYVEYQISETTGQPAGTGVPADGPYLQFCGFGAAPNASYFDFPMNIHRVFAKPVAGSYRFTYCTARLGSYTPQNTITNLILTATFFPTSYGTVTTALTPEQGMRTPVRPVAPLGADAYPAPGQQP